MTKFIIQGKNLLIASEASFVYHSLGSETFKVVRLLKKNNSPQDDGKETLQASQTVKERSVDKDVKINFVCLALSLDDKLLAVQSPEKELIVYEIQSWNVIYHRQLSRGASKILFSPDAKTIVLGDKTGDVFLYDIFSDQKETSLLGHLSMVLDIILSHDCKFIITCDRDEKIRVSNYPNSYNIQSYCLGHEQFVTNVQFLPHNKNLLISCSGDGTLRLWDYMSGKVKDIYVFNNVKLSGSNASQNQLKSFTSIQLNSTTSIVCVSLFKSNTLHVLLVEKSFQLSNTLNLLCEPADLQLSWYQSNLSEDSKDINLWVLGQKKLHIYTWNLTNKAFATATNPILLSSLSLLNSTLEEIMVDSNVENAFYVLQKRKMDEISDYFIRKQARLDEKINKKK